jgi:hypothetical protein
MDVRKSPQIQKDPHAVWANQEVMKHFQMVINEYVLFYKNHGKDKNRDAFLFVRISLKKTLRKLITMVIS